ncbi:MAG: hypothetical protein RSG57_04960 [Christensenellaceae bacterium]
MHHEVVVVFSIPVVGETFSGMSALVVSGAGVAMGLSSPDVIFVGCAEDSGVVGLHPASTLNAIRIARAINKLFFMIHFLSLFVFEYLL